MKSVIKKASILFLITPAVTLSAMDPLCKACKFGYVNEVKSLIAKNHNIHTTNQDGWKPLHIAARAGHADTMRLLIKAGALLNEPAPTGSTSLHLAAFNGHVACVKLLLQAKAALNALNLTDKTPLYKAFSAAKLLANDQNPSVVQEYQNAMLTAAWLIAYGATLDKESKYYAEYQALRATVFDGEVLNPEWQELVKNNEAGYVAPPSYDSLLG